MEEAKKLFAIESPDWEGDAYYLRLTESQARLLVWLFDKDLMNEELTYKEMESMQIEEI